MSNIYYYAVGNIIQELDSDGIVIESCVFLNDDGEYMYDGIQDAVVYQDEDSALKLAHNVEGRVIRVHSDFVDSMNIKIKD